MVTISSALYIFQGYERGVGSGNEIMVGLINGYEWALESYRKNLRAVTCYVGRKKNPKHHEKFVASG